MPENDKFTFSSEHDIVEIFVHPPESPVDEYFTGTDGRWAGMFPTLEIKRKDAATFKQVLFCDLPFQLLDETFFRGNIASFHCIHPRRNSFFLCFMKVIITSPAP